MNPNLFAENVRISSHPKIILVCGAARSGTTALSHIFIRAGVESHMQPIKSMIRAHHHGEEIKPWVIEGDEGRTILSKETLGANEDCEFFNPIRVLVELGYPRERILPVLIVREPHQNIASWHDLWRGVDPTNFIIACRKMKEIADYCNSQRIRHISFVHDLIRDNPVDDVVRRLLEKCGIPARVQDVINWISAPKFGPEEVGNPHLFFYDKPPEVFIGEVSGRGGYVYKKRPVSEDVQKFVAQHGEISDIYDDFCRRCEREFGVRVRTKRPAGAPFFLDDPFSLC